MSKSVKRLYTSTALGAAGAFISATFFFATAFSFGAATASFTAGVAFAFGATASFFTSDLAAFGAAAFFAATGLAPVIAGSVVSCFFAIICGRPLAVRLQCVV